MSVAVERGASAPAARAATARNGHHAAPSAPEVNPAHIPPVVVPLASTQAAAGAGGAGTGSTGGAATGGSSSTSSLRPLRQQVHQADLAARADVAAIRSALAQGDVAAANSAANRTLGEWIRANVAVAAIEASLAQRFPAAVGARGAVDPARLPSHARQLLDGVRAEAADAGSQASAAFALAGMPSLSRGGGAGTAGPAPA